MNLRTERDHILSALKEVRIVWWILFSLILVLYMLGRLSYIEWLSAYKLQVEIFFMVLFMAAAFTTNFTNKMGTLFGHFILYSFLTAMVSDQIMYKNLGVNEASTVLYLIIAFCIYLILISNTISVTFQLTRGGTSNTRFKYLSSYFNLFLIVLIYLVLVLFTIDLFANIYQNFIAYGSGVEGLIYASPEDVNSIMPKGWEDPLYFSSTTFFTVGFGDILPKGHLSKLVVQAEMLIGHILNIVMPALIFNLIVNKLLNDKEDKNC